jgi:hypothetical protein
MNLVISYFPFELLGFKLHVLKLICPCLYLSSFAFCCYTVPLRNIFFVYCLQMGDVLISSLMIGDYSDHL